jgi:hypothetical protein
VGKKGYQFLKIHVNLRQIGITSIVRAILTEFHTVIKFFEVIKLGTLTIDKNIRTLCQAVFSRLDLFFC